MNEDSFQGVQRQSRGCSVHELSQDVQCTGGYVLGSELPDMATLRRIAR